MVWCGVGWCDSSVIVCDDDDAVVSVVADTNTCIHTHTYDCIDTCIDTSVDILMTHMLTPLTFEVHLII